jgi:hypothetical protein
VIVFKRKSGSKPDKKAKAPKKPLPKRAKGPAAHVVVQKPDTDIYTVMLIISLISILIGCLLLWLELSRYGSYPWWRG